MANNNEFIIDLGMQLDKSDAQVLAKDLSAQIKKLNQSAKVTIKVDTNDAAMLNRAKEIRKTLQKELKRKVDVKIFDTAVKEISTFEKRIGMLKNKLANSGLDEYTSDFRSLASAIKYAQETLETMRELDDFDGFENLKNLMNGAEQKFDALIRAQQKQQAQTIEANNAIKVYEKELNKLIQLEVQLAKAKQTSKHSKGIYDVSAMNEYVEGCQKAVDAQKDQVEAARQAATATAGAERATEAYEDAQLKLENAVNKVNLEQKEHIGLLQNIKNGFKDAIQNVSSYTLAFSAIQFAVQQVRESIDTIIELDQAMVDLQIVTNSTRQEIHEMMKEYNQMAIEMGRSTKTVATSANEFLRMGYSAAESNELIRQSLMLSTLGMIDSAEATDYMISAMKGYGIAVEDVSEIIDMATELDMKYSISSGYIMEAMSRTAASAKLAGSEMSNLMAMISIVGETTKKSPEVVGEAMKTMYARFGNVKINKFEDAENPDEVEGINDIERVLNKLGVAIRESSGEWRNYDDVMSEVGKKFNELSDLEQNAIATAMFGTRQRENGIVILTNWNRVLEANEIALNASGTAEERMAYYNEGLGAAIERVGAAWERFLISLGDNSAVITLVNAFADLVECLSNPVIQSLLISGLLAAGIMKISVASINLITKSKLLGSALSTVFTSFRSGNKLTGALTDGIINYASNMGNAGLMTEEAANSMKNGASVAAKSAVSFAKLTGVIGGVMLAVQLVVAAFNAYQKKQEELMEDTIEAIDTWQDESDSIEELKNELTSLKKSYDSGNLSISESYKTRERLIQIEEELIKSYGLEKGSIDTVTDSIEKQIEKISELQKKKAQETYGNTKTEYDKAVKWMNAEVGTGWTQTAYSLGFLVSDYSKDKQVQSEISELLRQSGIEDNTYDGSGKSYTTVNMSRSDAIESLEKFNSLLTDYIEDHKELVNDEKFNKIFKQITHTKNWIIGDEEKYNKRKKIIEEGIDAQVQGYYTNELNEVSEAEDKYREAKLSGDKKAIDESYQYMIDKTEEAAKKAEKDGNTAVAKYFRDIAKEYEKTPVDKFKEMVTTGSQKWLGEAIINGVDVDENGNKIIDTLKKVAGWFGLTGEEASDAIEDIENSLKNADIATKSWADTKTTLEGIQSAYNDLSSAVDFYNENGYMTFDMLSALMDGGDKYLKYLSIENGKLKLNEKAMADDAIAAVNLNIAKLKLDQTNLIEKYSDESSNLDDLTKSTNEATEATTNLTEAELRLAQAKALLDGDADRLNAIINSAAYQNIEEQIKSLEALKKGFQDDFKNGIGGDGDGNSEDPYLDAFEKWYNNLKHMLNMDEIDEKEYYDRLEQKNLEYFANRKKYQEQYDKYEEEVYKGRKTLWKEAFDDELAELKKQLDRKIINEEQYLKAYQALVDYYYKDNPVFKDEYDKAESELYDLGIERIENEYDRWISLHEHHIEDMDYYNKWSLQQKLNYIAQEMSAMEKLYGNNEVLAEKFAETQKELQKQLYDTSKELAQQNLDTHDAYLEYVNNIIDKEVEALEEKKEALEEENDEREQAIELAELEEKLASARRNKVLIYRKGQGFVYEQDQTAVNEAQKEIDEYLYEREKEKRIDAIQDEIDAWEDYRDEWNRTVEAYNEEQTRLTALMYEGYAKEKDILEKKEGLIESYAESYAKAAQKVAEASQLINSGIYSMDYDPETGEFTSSYKGDNYAGGSGVGTDLYTEASRVRDQYIGNSGETWAILPSGNYVKVNVNSANKVTDSIPIGSTVVNASGAWTVTGGTAGAYEATEVKKKTTTKKSSGGGSSKKGSSGVGNVDGTVVGTTSSGSTLVNVGGGSHTSEVWTEGGRTYVDGIDVGPANADGTLGMESTQLSMVGEEGRELKILPKGTGIVPNPATETLMKFADNPAAFINSLNLPVTSSASGGDYTEVFNLSDITVNANNAEEFIKSLKGLKNKAIQKTSKRS